MDKVDFFNSAARMVEKRLNGFESGYMGLIQKAISSGCLDIDSQNPDDYATRQALVYVVFQRLAENARPLSKEAMKEAENIAKFI